MWGRSIIDWLELLCFICALGFSGLFISFIRLRSIVDELFRQHDESVLAQMIGLRAETRNLSELLKALLR